MEEEYKDLLDNLISNNESIMNVMADVYWDFVEEGITIEMKYIDHVLNNSKIEYTEIHKDYDEEFMIFVDEDDNSMIRIFMELYNIKHPNTEFYNIWKNNYEYELMECVYEPVSDDIYNSFINGLKEINKQYGFKLIKVSYDDFAD